MQYTYCNYLYHFILLTTFTSQLRGHTYVCCSKDGEVEEKKKEKKRERELQHVNSSLFFGFLIQSPIRKGLK